MGELRKADTTVTVNEKEILKDRYSFFSIIILEKAKNSIITNYE